LEAAYAFAISCVNTSIPALAEVDEHGLNYTIESTGVYHFPVLRAWKLAHAHVVNPLLAGSARRKTDVLDAELLAYHSLIGLWPPSYVPGEDVQILRIYLNAREDAQRTATRCSNRINNFILRFGHVFGATVGVRSPEGRAIVEDMCRGIVAWVQGVSPTGLPEDVWPVITELYASYDTAVADRKRYEKQCFAQMRKAQFLLGTGEFVDGKKLEALLRSVPGFGPLASLYWASEVCTPTRFPNAKAIAAYAGCDPSLKVSADKVTSHQRRHGNGKLHIALLHAAQPLIVRAREPLGEWGRSMWKRQKRGGFKRATTAVARRMIEASYHVTRLGEIYDSSKYRFFVKATYHDVLIDIEDVPRRYRAIILPYQTVPRLAAALDNGELAGTSGAGEKCLEVVKTILDKNRVQQEPPAPPEPTTTPSIPPSHQTPEPLPSTETAGLSSPEPWSDVPEAT